MMIEVSKGLYCIEFRTMGQLMNKIEIIIYEQDSGVVYWNGREHLDILLLRKCSANMVENIVYKTWCNMIHMFTPSNTNTAV
jgi:hypothetical protein